MNAVYLLLGVNLGDKKKSLQTAIGHIQSSVGEVVSESAVYETAPWGFHHEESFLNQAVLIMTERDPQNLLRSILGIEIAMGRTRNSERYSGRTIDIDILFFNEAVIEEKDLVIPHPHIQDRKFALVPLNEIATDYTHPKLQKKISTLLEECKDQLQVKRLAFVDGVD